MLTPIQEATTDELLDELQARFDNGVFLATKRMRETADATIGKQTITSWGDPFVQVGLLETVGGMAKARIASAISGLGGDDVILESE